MQYQIRSSGLRMNRYPNQYMIRLSTSEYIRISEYNQEVFPELFSPAYGLINLSQKCTIIDHDSMESAKRGEDSKLREKLRGDPTQNQLRYEDPVCRHKSSCAMYKKGVCSTHQAWELTKSKKSIPGCWEHNSEVNYIREINTMMVMDWRSGYRTVMVEK